MKNYKNFLILAVVLLLSGCGATEQLVLYTLEPSPVSISTTIKKIGIIDRTGQVSTIDGPMKIDRILAAEERWLDENATDAAITGLFDELLKDGRFEVIKVLPNIPEGMQDIGTAPNAKQWLSIKELCATNNIDAIFSLAYFDADTKVSLKKTKMTQSDMMRQQKTISAQELTLETFIENGWRIYDPMNQKLIDEITFNEQIISKGKGETPVLAYQSIENRRETMLAKSKNNGANYGQRLLPYPNTVSRQYYTKGSEKLVLAAINASSGDWENAIVLWEEEIENPNLKIKRRACHNLAVASEKAQNLNKALAWATLAFEANGDKAQLEYLNILQKRIDKQPLLEKQLAEINFLE